MDASFHFVHVGIGTLYVGDILECHDVWLLNSEVRESRRLERKRGGEEPPHAPGRKLRNFGRPVSGDDTTTWLVLSVFLTPVGKVNLYDVVRCQVGL